MLKYYQIILVSTSPRWAQNGETIAGGYGPGNSTNQLDRPHGLFIDNTEKAVFIADKGNNRIMKWNFGEQVGQIIVTKNNSRNRLNQPTDVLIDKKTGCLIICDHGNRRVMRWCDHNTTTQEILIDDIKCWGLALDVHRNLYISDTEKHEVRRYEMGDRNGTIVAGGNGQGMNLNQLTHPTYLFVDHKLTVYVSDKVNNRVMKWDKNTTIGLVVAGSKSSASGVGRTNLYYPQGLFVDSFENIYIADSYNDRVVCWPKRMKEGIVVVGGNGRGQSAYQFNFITGLSIDGQGSLYAADEKNHRIQRFTLR